MIATTVQWGTVPAWLTLGVFLVGLATFVYARRDSTRSLAAKAFVAVDSPRLRGVATSITVVNEGDAPIFDVLIHLWSWGSSRDWKWRFGATGDWMKGTLIDGASASVVLPHTADEVMLKGMMLPEGPSRATLAPPIVMNFRDGNGRSWVRWPDGKLSREYARRSRYSVIPDFGTQFPLPPPDAGDRRG